MGEFVKIDFFSMTMWKLKQIFLFENVTEVDFPVQDKKGAFTKKTTVFEHLSF